MIRIASLLLRAAVENFLPVDTMAFFPVHSYIVIKKDQTSTPKNNEATTVKLKVRQWIL